MRFDTVAWVLPGAGAAVLRRLVELGGTASYGDTHFTLWSHVTDATGLSVTA